MNGESLSSDECLVRVRAQVMARDESTGGWAPVVGGGLSYVGLRRISSTFVADTNSAPATFLTATKKTIKVQYVIIGHRISDESICLECVMRRDLQYNQVTPTFRHWQLHGKKFGLTFQSSGDAKAFDVVMERALKELQSYTPEPSPTLGKSIASEEEWDDREISTGSEKSEPSRRIPGKPARIFSGKPLADRRSASPQLSSISVPSPVRYQRAHMAEPAKRILSLPTSMTKSLSTPLQSPFRETSNIQTVLRLSSSHMLDKSSSKELSIPLGPITVDSASSCNERYTYVDVINTNAKSDERASCSTVCADPPSGPHDYHYPSLDSRTRTSEKRDSISSIKIHNLDMMSSHPPLLPIKNKRKRSRKRNKYSRGERIRCKFCHEFYSVDGNEYGACEHAPDKMKKCINRVSCIPVASKILYCCASSEETADQDSSHPCSCDTNAKSCFWRWLALTAMSLILPCLCCYYPLRGCHKLGLSCGLCGGKHEPMT